MQTTSTTEIWKPVVGMEEYYQISNHGRIMRREGAWGTFDGRILSPTSQKNGYRVVTLHGGGKVIGRAVARLVAEAFIPRPEGAHRVYHKGDISNDHAANLGWIVREERSKRRGAPPASPASPASPAPCQEKETEKEPTPVPTVKSASETELDTKVEGILELARMMRREAVELRESGTTIIRYRKPHRKGCFSSIRSPRCCIRYIIFDFNRGRAILKKAALFF